MDVFAHVHVLWLDRDVQPRLAHDASQSLAHDVSTARDVSTSALSSPLSRASRPSTREVRQCTVPKLVGPSLAACRQEAALFVAGGSS